MTPRPQLGLEVGDPAEIVAANFAEVFAGEGKLTIVVEPRPIRLAVRVIITDKTGRYERDVPNDEVRGGHARDHAVQALRAWQGQTAIAVPEQEATDGA